MSLVITERKARQICHDWHGGQWSAYYQFGSSGIYHIPNALRYLRETEDNLHPEYALHPGELSKKDENELLRLKRFFIWAGGKHGLTFEFEAHPVYGYLVPYLAEGVPEDICKQVTQLEYMK